VIDINFLNLKPKLKISGIEADVRRKTLLYRKGLRRQGKVNIKISNYVN
jgi:hypothetical protein